MDLETLLWCPACEGGYTLDRVVAYAKNLPGDRLCACCMTVWRKDSVPIEFFEFEVATPSLPTTPEATPDELDEMIAGREQQSPGYTQKVDQTLEDRRSERNEICETCSNTRGHIDHDSGPRTLTNPHPFKPKIPPEFYPPANQETPPPFAGYDKGERK